MQMTETDQVEETRKARFTNMRAVAHILSNRESILGSVTWETDGTHRSTTGTLVFSPNHTYGPLRLHGSADHWGSIDKWAFSVDFPRDNDHAVHATSDHKLINARPSINISALKKPERIALDLENRIIPDAYRTYMVALESVASANKYQESCDRVCASLVKRFEKRGIKRLSERYGSGKNILRFYMEKSRTSVDKIVCMDGYVNFDRLSMSAVQAEKVLDILLPKAV